jgi:hypothetical protein
VKSGAGSLIRGRLIGVSTGSVAISLPPCCQAENLQ